VLAELLEPPGPVDVVGTARGLVGVRRTADGLWWVTRTPDGPATVHVEPGATPRSPVAARAWGAGAELALAAVPDLLGFTDDGAWRPAHPQLVEWRRRQPGLRLGHTTSVVEALLPTIVAQKVPAIDAARAWRRLRRAFAAPAPGPARLTLPPDPRRLARLAYHDLHRFGIERRRAAPLLAACRVAPRLERLRSGGAPRLMAGLQQLPGIGAWTAASVVRAVTGGADVVVVGDYGLPSMVAWNLAGAAPRPGRPVDPALRRGAAAARPAPAGDRGAQSLSATAFGVTFIFGS